MGVGEGLVLVLDLGERGRAGGDCSDRACRLSVGGRVGDRLVIECGVGCRGGRKSGYSTCCLGIGGSV